MGPTPHVRGLNLVMGVLTGAHWVQNNRSLLLGRVVFWMKSTFLRGLSGTFLASNVTKVIVISDWNGSYGSMGSKGHVRCQDLVMGVLTGAPWVQNDCLGGSFLVLA